jgi:hypothetical protein
LRNSQRRRIKFEAFEELGILPSAGRKRKSLGASTATIRSAGEEDLDHWFLRPGEHQEKRTEGEIVDRRMFT